MAMGALLTKHDIPVLTHLTCRDRNVIGLQSHLLGLSALGMEEVLALTGDPARVGDFPVPLLYMIYPLLSLLK